MQARAGPQSFYEGWSSMNKQLIQKGWVASSSMLVFWVAKYLIIAATHIAARWLANSAMRCRGCAAARKSNRFNVYSLTYEGEAIAYKLHVQESGGAGQSAKGGQRLGGEGSQEGSRAGESESCSPGQSLMSRSLERGGSAGGGGGGGS
eukprot:265487-Rhodomonas_salina.3